MEKPSLKERLQYRFDNYMSHGSRNLITLLVICSAVLVFFAVCLMTAVMREPGSFLSNLWNGYVTLINAWMPEYDPGDPPHMAYLFFMAVIAIIGILFTSILIGIITSMIEEKVVSLRKGNSAVLEEHHTVVVGFYSGEYTLLRQLILASAGKPCTIVIAGEMDKDEMEQLIEDNIDVPKNVKLICRSIDIFEPSALERLAVKRADAVIVSPTDNARTTKILLALSTLIDKTDNVRICGNIYKDEYRLPAGMAEKHNILILHTNDTLAMMMARSCTQPGLSVVFRELFSFEGSELYLAHIAEAEGMTFLELSARMDKAVPAGIARNGRIRMNPPVWTRIQAADDILIFAEEKGSYVITENPDPDWKPAKKEENGGYRLRRLSKVCIFGYNKSLKRILRELPEHVREVLLVNPDTEDTVIDELRALYPKLSIIVSDDPDPDEQALVSLAEKYHHFMILNAFSDDDDKDDMLASFLLLKLRDIRERYHLVFNITAEMRREANQTLVETNDHTDFVVASNMSALFLAQLSKSPELLPAFSELLSREGSEVYLIKAKYLNAAGSYTIRQLRQIALANQYVLIGYINFRGEYRFNPALDKPVTPGEDDYLILIGDRDIRADTE